MKLSVQFISLVLAVSGTVNAVHHARGSHNHHHIGRRAVAVVTVTQTVIVDKHGAPVHTSFPDAPKANIQALNVPAETTQVTSTQEPARPKHTPQPKNKDKEDKKDDEEEEEDEPVEHGGEFSLDAEFPNGRIPCSRFPSAYGAVAVPWIELGGWTGIQIGGGAGQRCEDGGLCSYACPPGYSKGQWPEIQPASGESHGGLECRGGKLYRTNPNVKSLCVKGHGGVFVKNELSLSVPICRTDYPGCENMNVPLYSTPGSSLELTNPDGGTYYRWKGLTTSAQYYVNDAGVSLEEGCVWGKPDGGKGNWATMIFGAGYSHKTTWLSISQNQLNSHGVLNYNVEIIPGTPDTVLNGKCKYENGKFSGGGPGERGCTAALVRGTAIFRLYK